MWIAILVLDYLLGILFPIGYVILLDQGLVGFSWSVIYAVLVCFIFSLSTWIPIMFDAGKKLRVTQGHLASLGFFAQAMLAVVLAISAPPHISYVP